MSARELLFQQNNIVAVNTRQQSVQLRIPRQPSATFFRDLNASFTASDHISVLSDRNGELARHKRLSTDISNEVEVATIVFDETEMLEIKEVIALLFQSVDSQCGDGKEIRQKVCCNFRVSVLVIKVVAS